MGSAYTFSQVPRAEIPRSRFRRDFTHKTTIDADYLYPIFADEVLPGDTFQVNASLFARMTTPIKPLMDTLYLDTFFFFVPNRLLWNNWQKFMGEQDNPADSINYLVPKVTMPAAGYPEGSLYDYLGFPTKITRTTASLDAVAFWSRAYNLIWNDWFRDENLQNSVTVDLGDGPDTSTNYVLLKRGKRHDYFTSCLPWPQKGNTAVSIPIGSSAVVKTQATDTVTGAASAMRLKDTAGGATIGAALLGTSSANTMGIGSGGGFSGTTGVYPSNLYADLSTATAATINSLRQAFQIQKLLERDARGGTRYIEIIRSHFGVISPDARLQRPEYLGGSSQTITINPVTQTSSSGITGSANAQGNLAAYGVVSDKAGFSKSFTEHGVLLGLVSIRGELTYQQGLNRMYSRSTRYDYYWPAFANLGEQAVLNKEIYATSLATDDSVFGYQERWAEYRYKQSQVTGKFRSNATGPLHIWHLAESFGALPTLGATFIQNNTPMSRVVAVTTEPHFYFDSYFQMNVTRPMPMYSIPGLIDHF